MNIENIVKEFINDEGFTLKNTLAYAGLGLSKSCGAINEVVTGVGFSEHSYNDERKKRIAEYLGEMMFYWHALAGTCGVSPGEIEQQFVSLYLIKNNKVSHEMNASILELMKYVKTDVHSLDKKIDEEKKKKARALLNELQNLR